MKNLQIIAFSIDLARQKETVQFVKNQMKFCRNNGYNTIFLYLEAAVRASVTSFFDEDSSYSLAEIADIVGYGESIGLDVVPAFETLAHMEKFFVYDKLAGLAEFDNEQLHGRGFCSADYPHGSHGCVTNAQLQNFTDKYVAEVCSVFHSKYVHMGMDEMFQFACCDRCEQLVDKVTKQQMFVDFVLHAHSLVCGLGRRTMIWDDMLEYYQIADILPKDIVLCNWNYIFVGSAPRGKWTGRCVSDPFMLYDKLGLDYLFCCKAGNLSQVFNIDTYTRYAAKHNPLGAVLTSWERSDCFYPCLQPAIAYAGRKWSGNLNGKTAAEVFAEYIGDIDLSQRLLNLFAPDFVFCRTDVTRIAEENNHVITAYVSNLKATLNAFEQYSNYSLVSKSDTFVDLYANLCLQYADLSLVDSRNRIFDEYECGGVKNAQAYAKDIATVEQCFAVAEEVGKMLWAKYRGVQKSYGDSWQRACAARRKFVADLQNNVKNAVGQKKGVLKIRFMLPDTYSSIRGSIAVRYVGDKHDTEIFSGSTKTMLTMFDVSGEYVLRFSTEPRKVEYVIFTALGEGAQYPVYVSVFDGTTWAAPQSVVAVCGRVENESNLLSDDSSFAELGLDNGREHLDNINLSKAKNSIKIVF